MITASSENPKLYEFGYVAVSFAFSDKVEISQLKPCKDLPLNGSYILIVLLK